MAMRQSLLGLVSVLAFVALLVEALVTRSETIVEPRSSLLWSLPAMSSSSWKDIDKSSTSNSYDSLTKFNAVTMESSYNEIDSNIDSRSSRPSGGPLTTTTTKTTTTKTDPFEIRRLQEEDIVPLTRMFVQEWGPIGPQAQFTLFPAFCSADCFTFIDNFVLASVVYLGLAQRWNRKGLGSSNNNDNNDNDNDHVVLVILQDGQVLGAAEYSWQPKYQTALPLALPQSIKQQWQNLLHFLGGGKGTNEAMVPYISNVIISPSARGQGLATRLIQEVEKQVVRSWTIITNSDEEMKRYCNKEEPHPHPPPSIQIYLHVSHTATIAQNLYHRLGYETIEPSKTTNDDQISKLGKRLGFFLLGLYFMDPEPLEYRCKQLQ